MELTLVIVTLVSLALAMAMGVITWRLLQEERLRADARVAVLEQGFADSLQTTPLSRPETGTIERGAARAIVGDTSASARDDTDWLAQFPSSTGADRVAHDTTPGPRNDDDARDPGAGPAMSGTGSLFSQVQTADDSGGLSRRAVAIAAGAVVMIGAVLAVWTIGRLTAPAGDARAAQAASAAAPAALELVSLRHAQQDGTLTITGLVRNPHGGVQQARLMAVVVFFDGKGGFLTSTRAPLDFRALAPGDESPFQIATPAPPGAARFRVSFRRDEGAIVPHVDRRPQEASRS